MTKLLTPPLMFKGNQQAMAWARAVVDQGKELLPWSPVLTTVGSTPKFNASYYLTNYSRLGNLWFARLAVSFTTDVGATPSYIRFSLPSKTENKANLVGSTQYSNGGLLLHDPSNVDYLVRGTISGEQISLFFINWSGNNLALSASTTYTISGSFDYATGYVKSGT